MNARLSHMLAHHQPHAMASTQMDALAHLIEQACKVVAPLWPLATFAARSPWMDVEEQRFDTVAREFAQHQIALYPSIEESKTAYAKGELLEYALQQALQHWLRQLIEKKRQENQLSEIETKAWEEFALQDEWPLMLRFLQNSMLHSRPTQSTQSTQSTQLTSSNNRQLDAYCVRWCKLFVGRHNSAWPMNGADLFSTWRQQVEFDFALPKNLRLRLAALSKKLPDEPLAAILHALQERGLALAESDKVAFYLRQHLLALPGWCGMLRWQSEKEDNPFLHLYSFLALRLNVANVLLESAPNQAQNVPNLAESPPVAARKLWCTHSGEDQCDWDRLTPPAQHRRIELAIQFDHLAQQKTWLEARELHCRSQLKNALHPPFTAQHAQAPYKAPVAQLVFCIDVRSEPLRRAIEQVGRFQTFGCAGFFGMVVRSQRYTHYGVASHDACPVILSPTVNIAEAAASPTAWRLIQRSNVRRQNHNLFHHLKTDGLASLSLPELAAPWQALHMLWQSFASASWRRWVARRQKQNKPATRLQIARLVTNRETAATLLAHRQNQHAHQHSNATLNQGLTPAQQVEWAANALRNIGLVDGFSALVVIVGHGSRSRNNPYAAKLDCGACGGASGAFNARLLAELCNLASVREGLSRLGICIPDYCEFVACEHVTSRDCFEWQSNLPTQGLALNAWQQLQAQLPTVFASITQQRQQQLHSRTDHLQQHSASDEQAELWQRSDDWSEVRPEWGLAGNRAFIIGPREFTRQLDLKGQVFLHSYDATLDHDDSLLRSILAGPALVAQWINLQYYASTVAPHFFGSGSKTTQSITSGLGVMQGNGSDLLAGLPWQAVMANDQTPYHQALRLCIVIIAPQEKIARVLASSPVFAQKVRNQWLHLASICPNTLQWHDWHME